MITDTRERILHYISSRGQARVSDLQQVLGISSVAIHKHLKKLLASGSVVRLGKPPIVFYSLPAKPDEITKNFAWELLSVFIREKIEKNFLSITPDGRLLYGLKGFEYWVSRYQKNKPVEVVADEYVSTLETQNKQRNSDKLIEASSKLLGTFGQTPITHLFFQDIYSYRVFGRTKLAKLVMYAKQTGEKKLIDEISDDAKAAIDNLIKRYHIEAVAYIPPTVPRPLQFIYELDSRLHIPLPEVQLAKVVPGDIPIPQKTLSSLEERVINARDSIFLKNAQEPGYKNVLLIDDVTGSGASFQETAKKLRSNGIGEKNIIAFAFVGNIKGYDVIREI